jgi:hypothetical protein
VWAADNGCFGKGYPGDVKWLRWLQRHSKHSARCLFATAPDVLGDAKATLERSAEFLPMIRALGYPAALVAQDGLEDFDIPWDEFDVLFIGGTDNWKLGPPAAAVTRAAILHGKQVHMGRVNSGRRWARAEIMGCASVDGTFLARGPDKNLPRLIRWTAPSLFTDSPTTPVSEEAS